MRALLPPSAGVVLVLAVCGLFSASAQGSTEAEASSCAGSGCAAGEGAEDDHSSLLQSVRHRRQPDEVFDEIVDNVKNKKGVLHGLPGLDDPAQETVGTDIANDYTYTFQTDCYGNTSGRGYECPPGTWCQVEQRPNWYPWDVSYMNRGRCVNYTKLGGACEAAFEGETAFPRKEDGGFFSRPVLCGPEKEAVCTGEDLQKVLPPTCVRRRDPCSGCFSSRPFCAGRPAGKGNTTEEQLESGECPPDTHDFCVCPKGCQSTKLSDGSTSCTSDSKVTRETLEKCGSVFVGFNGPNFAFEFRGFANLSNVGLPSDTNIEPNQTRLMWKLPLSHGTNEKLANDFLYKLWPYPVCNADKGVTENCTKFPLPAAERDNDGGLTGKFSDGTDTDFYPEHGAGVTDYHCSWMILHTLTFNGGPVLTSHEQKAMAEMVMYLSGQFDCKVCRNNFNHIIETFGVPEGPLRETYAKWIWRAHNIANEHTYATHSPSNQQILESNGRLSASDRRWDMWANPEYMHPWFMTFGDAEAMWTLD